MNAWPELMDELDYWRDQGDIAAFWWRDDDAATATPEIDELIALRDELDVPVAIAVIPARADGSLADAVTGAAGICVLQHGYAHRNHADEDEKKIELGGRRAWQDVVAEILQGRERLAGLFGGTALPVMVPPWNRIDPDIVPRLPALGYAGLSGFAPRKRRAAADGLVTVNTHIDIIDWHGTRAFGGESTALAAAIGHLAAKRAGAADDEEPTGLLTHHLVHDPGCWAFIRRFVNEISTHPAACWISARNAFGVAA